jgi:hypothetical protein
MSTLLVALFVASSTEASPTLNYQGRITASGSNFTGQGHFKFVLLNEAGHGVWSNDGTGMTNEPGVAVAVEVNNGLFAIELGNTALSGMAAISPLAFHQRDLQLRTWFSTNNVAFQRLSPDTAIRSPDFAHLNTGRMVVVDRNGRADFDNLAEALAAVGTDTNYDGILVMPGQYELSAPLALDVDHAFLITGISPAVTRIVNTNGPALELRSNCYLEKLSVEGCPAIAIGVQGSGIIADECYFGRSTAGPVIDCTGTGTLHFTRCTLSSAKGCGLRIEGVVSVWAEDCSIAGAELGSSVAGYARFERCDLGCITVHGQYGPDVFYGCTLDSVVLTNMSSPIVMDQCRISGGLIFDGCTNPANHEVRNTTIVFDKGPGIALRGSTGTWWFKNVEVKTATNTALVVSDVLGDVQFADCELQALDGTPVQVTASAALPQDGQVRVLFDRCRVLNAVSEPDRTDDGIVVQATPMSGNVHAFVRILRSVVLGIRNGVSSDGGAVQIEHSMVEGGQSAVTCTNSPICMIGWSALSAGNGTGPSSDMVHFTGQGHCNLHMFHSTSTRTGGTPGRGLYAALDTNGTVYVADSVLVGVGDGAGLECEAARLSVSDSIVEGGAQAPAVLLRNSAISASLRSSALQNSAGQNTNDVVVLMGNGPGATAPTPQIIDCVIATESTNDVRSIGLAGGATTGNVVLVHTSMSKDKSNQIGLVAPTNTLSYGNYVFPGLR